MQQDDPGIYPKYVVFKHPKEPVEEFEAEGWRYFTDRGGKMQAIKIDLELVEDFVFVLKPIKDRAARLALAVYAEAVRHEKPRLAEELKEILDDFQGT